MSNITHEMRGAVGRQTGRRVSFPITEDTWTDQHDETVKRSRSTHIRY
jgi:hypothetical protein